MGVLTQTKRMEIYSVYMRMYGYDPLPEYVEPKVSPISQPKLAEKYPLILINARTRYMTQSQLAGMPSIRKRVPNPYFEIHPDTAREYGVEDGDWAYIETKEGKIKEQTKVTDKIIPGVVSCTFGWWQGCPQLGIPPSDPFGPEGANFALLINGYEDHDPMTGSIPLHGYLCSIKKAEAAEPVAK